MVRPIVLYGHKVLTQKCEPVPQDYPELNSLIADMFETMKSADGIGLAAPQIGLSIRLFVVDTSAFGGDTPDKARLKTFKQVFINPTILEEKGEEWPYKEGCLSIPQVLETVHRKSTIRVKYYDQNFEEKEETFTGMIARVVQHEYDHINGILFTSYVKGLKRTMMEGKLRKIIKRKITPDYLYE